MVFRLRSICQQYKNELTGCYFNCTPYYSSIKIGIARWYFDCAPYDNNRKLDLLVGILTALNMTVVKIIVFNLALTCCFKIPYTS